jgi:hypothetical protein
MGFRARPLNVAIELALALIVALQALIVMTQYAIPWAGKIWPLRHDAALVRGGTLAVAFGKDVTDYIVFARSLIPDQGTVVIPPEGTAEAISNRFLMQFYFFPRQIHQCTDVAMELCLSSLPHAETYILACGQTHLGEFLGERFTYHAFKTDCGLYSPIQDNSTSD